MVVPYSEVKTVNKTNDCASIGLFNAVSFKTGMREIITVFIEYMSYHRLISIATQCLSYTSVLIWHVAKGNSKTILIY